MSNQAPADRASSWLTFELSKYDKRFYEKDGEQKPYLGLIGYSPSNKRVNVITFQAEVVDFMKSKLDSIMEEGEGRRIVIAARGDWRQRKKPGTEIWETSFVARWLEVKSGPAVELALARRDTALVLEASELLRAAGDHKSAYATLEAHVARFARIQAPSSGVDHDLVDVTDYASSGDSPEEEAQRKFDAIDARKIAPTQIAAQPNEPAPTSSASVAEHPAVVGPPDVEETSANDAVSEASIVEASEEPADMATVEPETEVREPEKSEPEAPVAMTQEIVAPDPEPVAAAPTPVRRPLGRPGVPSRPLGRPGMPRPAPAQQPSEPENAPGM